MQVRLRPQIIFLRRRETLLHVEKLRVGLRSFGVGLVGRARTPRLFYHVDRIAAAQEVLGPALAAIRGAVEIGGGLRRPRHDHQRVGLGALLRALILDVSLPSHDLLVADGCVFAADEEIALLGDRKRLRGAGRRCESKGCDARSCTR